MTLEQVCAEVTKILGASRPMSRGTMSAIETGVRGASQEVLAALEHVYGIDPGSIVTDFQPRPRGSNGGDKVA